MTFTTRPTCEGTFGMVSSTHWLASQSAMARCSSAAATPSTRRSPPGSSCTSSSRTSTVPAARCPPSSPPRTTRPRSCCAARGRAPAGATIEHFRSSGLDLDPGLRALGGRRARRGRRLAAAAAGPRHAVAEEVLEPAIGYARHGHPLIGRVGATVEAVRDCSGALADLRRPLAPRRPAPGAGILFGNPAYADTLEPTGRRGQGGGRRPRGADRRRPARWSEGFVAEAVDAFRAAAVPGLQRRPHAGLVTGADMAALLGDLGGARDHRLPRLRGREDRVCGARARCCWRPRAYSTRCPTRRSTRPPRGHARRRGGPQARLRRPRGVVRRRRTSRSPRCSRRRTPERAAP